MPPLLNRAKWLAQSHSNDQRTTGGSLIMHQATNISHNAEPWLYQKRNNLDFPEVNDFEIKTESGELIANTFELVGRNRLTVNPEANARRIVACVNKCAHISTENLENSLNFVDAINAPLRMLDKVQALQTELLATLYKALPFIEDHEGNEVYKPGAVQTMLKEIREAIAKAEAING
jgi:hypothetical protein